MSRTSPANATAVEVARLPRSAFGLLWRATVALILITLGARLGWGIIASRRVAAYVSELRAQQQPVTFEDLSPQPVDESDDGWPLVQRAISELDTQRPAALPITPPLTDRQMADWTDREVASESILAHLAELPHRRQFGMPVTKSASVPTYLTALAQDLANLGVYAHATGRENVALDRVACALRLVEPLRKQGLARFFQGSQIELRALHATQAIAAQLNDDVRDPATREQVQELLKYLLDERATWQAFRNAMLWDRAVAVSNLRLSAAGSGWFLQPVADMAVLRSDRSYQPYLRAAELQSLPAASHEIGVDLDIATIGWQVIRTGGLPDVRSVASRVARMYSLDVSRTADYPQYVLAHYERIAERRMTAISLAAQLYRLEHEGAWPKSLRELCPGYLRDVPADPYSEHGVPIGYELVTSVVRNGRERPVVFVKMEQAGAQQFFDRAEFALTNAPASRRFRFAGSSRDLSRFDLSRPKSTHRFNRDRDQSGAPGK